MVFLYGSLSFHPIQCFNTLIWSRCFLYEWQVSLFPKRVHLLLHLYLTFRDPTSIYGRVQYCYWMLSAEIFMWAHMIHRQLGEITDPNYCTVYCSLHCLIPYLLYHSPSLPPLLRFSIYFYPSSSFHFSQSKHIRGIFHTSWLEEVHQQVKIYVSSVYI